MFHIPNDKNTRKRAFFLLIQSVNKKQASESRTCNCKRRENYHLLCKPPPFVPRKAILPRFLTARQPTGTHVRVPLMARSPHDNLTDICGADTRSL